MTSTQKAKCQYCEEMYEDLDSHECSVYFVQLVRGHYE